MGLWGRGCRADNVLCDSIAVAQTSGGKQDAKKKKEKKVLLKRHFLVGKGSHVAALGISPHGRAFHVADGCELLPPLSFRVTVMNWNEASSETLRGVGGGRRSTHCGEWESVYRAH